MRVRQPNANLIVKGTANAVRRPALATTPKDTTRARHQPGMNQTESDSAQPLRRVRQAGVGTPRQSGLMDFPYRQTPGQPIFLQLELAAGVTR